MICINLIKTIILNKPKTSFNVCNINSIMKIILGNTIFFYVIIVIFQWIYDLFNKYKKNLNKNLLLISFLISHLYSYFLPIFITQKQPKYI